MPVDKKFTSGDRTLFRGSISRVEAENLAAEPGLRVLQTLEPVELATAEILNEHFFPKRPDVTFRIFGFHSTSCDLSFLTRMPNVRKFSADCLTEVRSIEYLSSLPRLEVLGVGIYELENFDFLADVPATLVDLSLHSTKSKKPSLRLLSRFRDLKRLFLEGQKKDVEALSDISQLEELTLRSITTSGLEFLRPLKRLWSLRLLLGGTDNLSAIEAMTTIKYLQLLRIRGLSDLSVISTLVGLQYLFLEDLCNVPKLPNFSKLRRLRRIRIMNLKRLTDVSAIEDAPALEEFVHTLARNMEPSQYKPILAIKTLKSALVGFGNAKKDTEFEAIREAAGIRHDRVPILFTPSSTSDT